MANEVSHVIFDRAKKAGRLSVEQILSVIEMEAQNQADIDFVLQRIRRHRGIVLLPLEVVLTAESVESLLATATGRADKLRDARALTQGDAIGATHATARSFRFVHKSEFDTAAHALTLRPDSVEVVNQLRRRGYAVGVVSDGFYAIAEIVRRRVFADFAIAHTIQFAGDVCQGEASINRAFAHERGCGKHAHCMSNIIAHLRQGERDVPLEHIVAVGALATHACFVEAADAGVVLDASGATLRHARGARVVHSLNALVPHLDIATPLARVA